MINKNKWSAFKNTNAKLAKDMILALRFEYSSLVNNVPIKNTTFVNYINKSHRILFLQGITTSPALSLNMLEQLLA